MISDIELVLRLALAVVSGGIIGFERELRHKSAGFRTNILICLGAALFTVVSIKITADYTTTVADPGRIAAQIVTGVGFIGAGAIWQSRASVTGITTAATIWLTAAIGMTIGMGYYHAAVITAVVAVIILHALIPFEQKLRKRRSSVRYYIRYGHNETLDKLIKDFYRESFVSLGDLNFEVEGDRTIIRMNVRHKPEEHLGFKTKLREAAEDVTIVDF